MIAHFEFYRTRLQDKAHAVLARETRDVEDKDDALEIGWSLWCDLNMPQRPDEILITDAQGTTLYRGNFEERDL